ncbi:hypothetical protein FA15DRAFT_709481 [Coprinopsis marcescibilis]|uniref:F-box domain-containing protein n=1 Tax=Coprinopsis marcescibilis TaxID=230819 RepID=A0A5C3KFN1_COPMA|nr:hypothetical protein FA15DRAFT_709481 [Coprinopsis marcescibilis]
MKSPFEPLLKKGQKPKIETIREIEAYLKPLQKRIIKMKAQYKELEASIKRHNLDCFIEGLSVELLSQTFDLCLPDKLESRVMDVSVAPLQLMGVNQRWRDVAKQERSLWTTINVPQLRNFGNAPAFRSVHEEISNRWLERVDAWVERSHNRPLDVTLNLNSEDDVLPTVLARSKLWSSRGRWRSLTIRCRKPSTQRVMHQNLNRWRLNKTWALLNDAQANSDFKALTSIGIQMDHKAYLGNEFRPVISFVKGSLSNGLQELYFRGEGRRLDSPETLLEIITAAGAEGVLTHLDLCVTDWYPHPEDFDKMLAQVLQAVPKLVSLTLDSFCPDLPLHRTITRGPFRSAKINHDNLRHLAVDTFFGSPSYHLFQKLVLPALTSLDLTFSRGMGYDHTEDMFIPVNEDDSDDGDYDEHHDGEDDEYDGEDDEDDDDDDDEEDDAHEHDDDEEADGDNEDEDKGVEEVEENEEAEHDERPPPSNICNPVLHEYIPFFLKIRVSDDRCFTREGLAQISQYTPYLESLRLLHYLDDEPHLPKPKTGYGDRIGDREYMTWNLREQSFVLAWPKWTEEEHCNIMPDPELDRMSKSIEFANAMSARKTASSIPADQYIAKLTPLGSSVVPWQVLRIFEWNVRHSDNFSDKAIISFIRERANSERCADIEQVSLLFARLQEVDVAEALKDLVHRNGGLTLQLDYADQRLLPVAAIYK